MDNPACAFAHRHMQAVLTVSVARGLAWLSEGFELFRKQPLFLSFLVFGYWISMGMISAVPIGGRTVGFVLIPVFSVSLMNACRQIAQSRPLKAALLFSGFARNLRPLLHLGVLYILVGAAILALTLPVDDGVIFRWLVLGERVTQEALTSDASVQAAQLALALFVPVVMAYWYSPVLVAWHDFSPGKALFFSLMACARNWRAFLAYALAVVVVGAFVPGALAGLLGSLAGEGGASQLTTPLITLFVLVFLPVVYASFYVSYRDVFVADERHG